MPKVFAEEANAAALSPVQARFAEAPGFQQAVETVQGHCSMCHAAEPVWEGIIVPPKGVMLDTQEQIAMQARKIYLQAARSHAMPPGNLSSITQAERRQIADWYEAAISSR